jgi:acetylornithine deacetylase
MSTLLSDEDLLARLVAFDSTSHLSNLPIVDFLSDYLDRPGVRLTRNPAPDEPKTNLVVELGPDADPATRDGLMLSGHVDVVPATEPEWQTDPFQLSIADDRYTARGACDMKGFVALAVNALLRTRERGTTLRAPLALVITYDEELGTLGARHFVETWPADHPLPRRSVIGEPTSLEVVRLHKGHTKMRLTLKGKPAHSGYPHLGHNAIEPMGRAIVALSELRRRLQAEGGPNIEHFPEVPFVAFNLAQVHGGVADNIVPEHCYLMIGFRVLPGMESAPIEAKVQAAVDEALRGESYLLERINLSPPMALDAGDDLYRHLTSMVGQERTISASYATDAGWFQKGGFTCLLYGPGDIATAHKPNEWLPRAQFEKAAGDLDQLIDHFCVR